MVGYFIQLSSNVVMVRTLNSNYDYWLVKAKNALIDTLFPSQHLSFERMFTRNINQPVIILCL